MIPYGKYKGASIADVARRDPSYLHWVLSLRTQEESAMGAFAKASTDEIMAALSTPARDAPPIQVTPHQQDAVNYLRGHILAGAPVVRLDGGAGYGKSYTVKKLLTALRDEHGIQAAACATSYVATQVLARDLEPHGFEAKTVARTLRQIRETDRDTGADRYSLSPESYEIAPTLLGPGRALVVDECSMVNDEITRFLTDAADQYGGHLILVGDECQLPPVRQETPSIGCTTEPFTTLTEPMRYPRDSFLFHLEQTVRRFPSIGALKDTLEDAWHTTEAACVARHQLVHQFVENYREDPARQHRMLLFRRQDVADANTAIRAELYGPDAPIVVDDERLMVLRTSDYPYVGRNSAAGQATRFYSGETFVVEHAEQAVYARANIPEPIPHWRVRLQGHAQPVNLIFAISDTQTDPAKLGGPEYQSALKAAFEQGRGERRDWSLLKQLQGDFLAVSYLYATSVHRAQGQTTDYAYVMPAPLLAVGGITGRALTYVAMTRARKQITVAL